MDNTVNKIDNANSSYFRGSIKYLLPNKICELIVERFTNIYTVKKCEHNFGLKQYKHTFRLKQCKHTFRLNNVNLLSD